MENEIIVITGGTSGLGLELVKQSIEKGFFVCNISRNKEKINELDKIFVSNYKGFVGDISDEDFVINTVKEISTIRKYKDIN